MLQTPLLLIVLENTGTHYAKNKDCSSRSLKFSCTGSVVIALVSSDFIMIIMQ